MLLVFSSMRACGFRLRCELAQRRPKYNTAAITKVSPNKARGNTWFTAVRVRKRILLLIMTSSISMAWGFALVAREIRLPIERWIGCSLRSPRSPSTGWRETAWRRLSALHMLNWLYTGASGVAVASQSRGLEGPTVGRALTTWFTSFVCRQPDRRDIRCSQLIALALLPWPNFSGMFFLHAAGFFTFLAARQALGALV